MERCTRILEKWFDTEEEYEMFIKDADDTYWNVVVECLDIRDDCVYARFRITE